MIKNRKNDISECVKVIRQSFLTVADELTSENAPRFTAFATTENRLNRQLNEKHRPMYACYKNDTIVGYYSLLLQGTHEYELNTKITIRFSPFI